MNQTVSRSMLSRLLSVATVLTLVGFAASVDLQPQSALASPGASADLSAGVISLADDNGNRDGNDNDNRNNDDENRNHDENNNGENRKGNDENRENNENENNHENHENHEQNGNTGGQGIFSTICSVPGFANNVGCASGLLGN